MESSFAGKLLIAMPGIGDPRFDHAVILLCLHTEDHAMGLVLNKPKPELTLGDVLEHLGIVAGGGVAAQIVLTGGPVKQDRGYVLHSEEFYVEDATHDVAPGIRLTATRDVLEALAMEDRPARFVLALGYSGWGAGQLESEIARNAWLVAEPEQAIVFGQNHDAKWGQAIAQLGFDPAQLTGDVAGRA